MKEETKRRIEKARSLLASMFVMITAISGIGSIIVLNLDYTDLGAALISIFFAPFVLTAMLQD